MKRLAFATGALAALLGTTALADTVSKMAVLDTYADIAEAKYADSLSTARALQAAVDALIASPSDATLQAAKDAWRASRARARDSTASPCLPATVASGEG